MNSVRGAQQRKMAVFRIKVDLSCKRSMLLVFWHRQRLVQVFSSTSRYILAQTDPPELQRRLSATADELVIIAHMPNVRCPLKLTQPNNINLFIACMAKLGYYCSGDINARLLTVIAALIMHFAGTAMNCTPNNIIYKCVNRRLLQ